MSPRLYRIHAHFDNLGERAEGQAVGVVATKNIQMYGCADARQ